MLSTALSQYVRHVTCVYANYTATGPGQLDEDDFAALQQERDQLTAASRDVAAFEQFAAAAGKEPSGCRTELDQAVELDVAFAPMQSTSAPAP